VELQNPENQIVIQSDTPIQVIEEDQDDQIIQVIEENYEENSEEEQELIMNA
jgi:hypothetical protein